MSPFGGVALCLHGKIGAWDIGPSHLVGGLHNRTATYATLAHSTIAKHILQANQRDGLRLDVFLHSWNPEVGPTLDSLYLPNASLHQPPERSLEAVRSGHLSLKRVLLLLRASEAPGQEFSLVMLSRFDVLWYNDLLLRGLSPSRIWLPHHCQPRIGLSTAEERAIEAVCESDRGALMEPVYTQRSFGVHLQRHVNYNSFVLDYWFVSSVEVAESFAAIYHQHEEYQHDMALLMGGWRPFKSHFYWAYHISTLLLKSAAAGATGPALQVGFISQSELDFNLARFFQFGNDCLADAAPLREALPSTLEKMSAKLTPNPFQSAGPMLGLGSVSPPEGGGRKEHAGNTSWLAPQCPEALRSGRSLQCPWYSRRCSDSQQHRVRQLLAVGAKLKAQSSL